MPLEVSSTQQQQGSLLKILFSIKAGKAKCKNRTESFKIDSLAEIWFVFKNSEDFYNTSQTTTISMRICKQKTAKDATVKMNVICEKLKYSNQFDCPEISTYWIDLGSITHSHSEAFSLEISLIVCKTVPITFTKLYYDTDVTDFHLCTAEGSSVPVHKACLAAHSDVFKAMLNREWKETVEGCVELKGVTLQTLQHLKDYMYLGILPEEGLQTQILLQIAKCYMIENLKDDCILKLAQTVTFLNLFPLLQFACENNLPELSFMLLQLTPSAIIHSAHQMRKLKQGCKKADIE